MQTNLDGSQPQSSRGASVEIANNIKVKSKRGHEFKQEYSFEKFVYGLYSITANQTQPGQGTISLVSWIMVGNPSDTSNTELIETSIISVPKTSSFGS